MLYSFVCTYVYDWDIQAYLEYPRILAAGGLSHPHKLVQAVTVKGLSITYVYHYAVTVLHTLKFLVVIYITGSPSATPAYERSDHDAGHCWSCFLIN
jgi:hypothetical protein